MRLLPSRKLRFQGKNTGKWPATSWHASAASLPEVLQFPNERTE